MNRLLLALACLSLVACNTDPGPIMLTDAGVAPTDAPIVATDAPVAPTDAPPACGPAMAPAPTGMVCLRATLTCIMAATTAAAQQACITADPAGMACLGCINQQIISGCTVAPAMCADEYGTLQCCLLAACPTADAACINTALTGTCGAQANAVTMCANTEQMATRCGLTAHCFMP